MPYVTEDEYSRLKARDEKQKALYRKINQANKTRYKTVTIRMKPRMFLAFDKVCQEMGVSRNSVINGLIEDFLRQYNS